MKTIIATLILATLAIQSCQEKKNISSFDPVNWGKRKVENNLSDSVETGTTYLSVYSQIYSESENRIYDLTVTISLRNTSRNDTIHVDRADYYNTRGDLIRSYFNHPIYIAPMETVEIVIDQVDREGGTGANFIFDWEIPPDSNEPLFEAVMISTYSQGISFTTQGNKIK